LFDKTPPLGGVFCLGGVFVWAAAFGRHFLFGLPVFDWRFWLWCRSLTGDFGCGAGASEVTYPQLMRKKNTDLCIECG